MSLALLKCFKYTEVFCCTLVILPTKLKKITKEPQVNLNLVLLIFDCVLVIKEARSFSCCICIGL